MSLWVKYKAWCLQLCAYFILFLWFYHPFIEQNMLPGRIDSWFNFGIFKHYSNLFNHFLTDTPAFIANYPEGKVFLYGESSLLTGLLFAIIDRLFDNDLTAYISLYVVIQTFNSLSFALFIKSFLKTNYSIAFVAGLFFSFSAFNLAFYDNIVYAIWFPIFISLYFLHKAFKQDTTGKYLFLASLLLYIQIYFSVYNFMMGLVLHGVLISMLYANRFAHWKKVALYYLLLTPIAFPFIYLYVIDSQISSSFNDYLTIDIIDSLGFQFSDLYHSFKTNMLYGGLTNYEDTVNDYWHVGNLGIITFILALIGFYSAQKRVKISLGVILLTGLLLAFGPFWGSIKSPSFYLYQFLPIIKQFKLIFKFYYLVQISVIILSIKGLIYLSSRFKNKKHLLYFLLSIVFLIENLPMHVLEYTVPFERPVLDQKTLLALKNPSNSVLFMPFCAPMFPEENNKDCFVEGREIEFKYLYWQAFLGINMLNGANGTIPNNRLRVNDMLDNMSFEDAVSSLKQSHDLKYIYYDKKVNYTFKNPNIQEMRAYLNILTETEDYLIFMVQ